MVILTVIVDLKIQGLLPEYYTVVTVVVTIEQKTVVPTFLKVFQTAYFWSLTRYIIHAKLGPFHLSFCQGKYGLMFTQN